MAAGSNAAAATKESLTSVFQGNNTFVLQTQSALRRPIRIPYFTLQSASLCIKAQIHRLDLKPYFAILTQTGCSSDPHLLRPYVATRAAFINYTLNSSLCLCLSFSALISAELLTLAHANGEASLHNEPLAVIKSA